MYYVLILIMTSMGAIASIFFKKASSSNGIMQLLLNINLYIGGFLYLASAILNIIVLKYLNYSVVLPLTSITYIWTMIFSYLLLKEKITMKKAIGVSCIVLGAICVAVS